MARKKMDENVKVMVLAAVAFLAVFTFARAMEVGVKGKVLGESWLLADRGSDDGDNSGSGSSNSGSGSDDGSDDNSGSGSSGSGSSGSGSSGSGSSGSGSSGSGSSGSGSSGSGSSGSGGSSGDFDDDDRGVCVGPDGSSFTSDFDDCKELNDAWGTSTNFTVTESSSARGGTGFEVEDEDENEVEDEDEVEIEDETEDEDEVEGEDAVQRVIRELREDESREEIRLSETERIRVRTKDGRTRIDVYSGGVKTRFEFRDDRVIVKAEIEGEDEQELEENDIFTIRDRVGEEGIRVATAAGERFVVARGAVAAATEFPITVDFSTNALSVITPNGVRQIGVLPGEASAAVQALGLINEVLGIDRSVIESGQVTSISQLVELVDDGEQAVYEINGVSGQRLLGLFPVRVPRTVVVSAEDGRLVEIQEGLFATILDAVSF